jgi:hypothetical protein
MDTMPTTLSELRSGVSASRAARRTAPRLASTRLAPSASSASTPSRPPPASSSSTDDRPTATEEQALPSSMPSIGMRYCASYHGRTRTAAARPNAIVAKQAPPMASSTCGSRPG